MSFWGYGDIAGPWYSRPDAFYRRKPLVTEPRPALPSARQSRGASARKPTGSLLPLLPAERPLVQGGRRPRPRHRAQGVRLVLPGPQPVSHVPSNPLDPRDEGYRCPSRAVGCHGPRARPATAFLMSSSRSPGAGHGLRGVDKTFRDRTLRARHGLLAGTFGVSDPLPPRTGPRWPRRLRATYRSVQVFASDGRTTTTLCNSRADAGWEPCTDDMLSSRAPSIPSTFLGRISCSKSMNRYDCTKHLLHNVKSHSVQCFAFQ